MVNVYRGVRGIERGVTSTTGQTKEGPRRVALVKISGAGPIALVDRTISYKVVRLNRGHIRRIVRGFIGLSNIG